MLTGSEIRSSTVVVAGLRAAGAASTNLAAISEVASRAARAIDVALSGELAGRSMLTGTQIRGRAIAGAALWQTGRDLTAKARVALRAIGAVDETISVKLADRSVLASAETRRCTIAVTALRPHLHAGHTRGA